MSCLRSSSCCWKLSRTSTTGVQLLFEIAMPSRKLLAKPFEIPIEINGTCSPAKPDVAFSLAVKTCVHSAETSPIAEIDARPPERTPHETIRQL